MTGLTLDKRLTWKGHIGTPADTIHSLSCPSSRSMPLPNASPTSM